MAGPQYVNLGTIWNWMWNWLRGGLHGHSYYLSTFSTVTDRYTSIIGK